ncbi:MAG: glycerol-3-phosphate dehydrogenase subunit GlpB [Natronomonas sp.]
MAIHSEVLVVGGGLAGKTAAIAASRAGADVRILSKNSSTLRQASGLVDVLGYLPIVDRPRAISNPFDRIADLPDDHPYSIVGVDALRNGLALFDDVTANDYRGDHTPRNALIPTISGTVKPTGRYPSSMAPGLASDDRSALIVGFRSTTDFDARLLADRLANVDVPFDVEGVDVSFGKGVRDDAIRTHIARALDQNEPLHGSPARTALADAISPHLGDAERVGLPAVLGLDAHETVRSTLEDRLGVAVFELPGGPPSIPGLRLESCLDGAVDSSGVRRETGNPVVGFEATGEEIETVTVDRNGTRVSYGAERFVLATGGLVGKGITANRESVREPVFGCHIPHPSDRPHWYVDEVFGDQPYARFGVRTDDDLRPLDADGISEFSNLHAAGAVLGGADVAREKSAGGVSLATGYAAGRAAAQGCPT